MRGMQAQAFYKKTTEFLEKFKQEGPGLPNLELPTGYDLLLQFSSELDQLRLSRDDIVLAEKLFDMTITDYPDLVQVYSTHQF